MLPGKRSGVRCSERQRQRFAPTPITRARHGKSTFFRRIRTRILESRFIQGARDAGSAVGSSLVAVGIVEACVGLSFAILFGGLLTESDRR